MQSFMLSSKSAQFLEYMDLRTRTIYGSGKDFTLLFTMWLIYPGHCTQISIKISQYLLKFIHKSILLCFSCPTVYIPACTRWF